MAGSRKDRVAEDIKREIVALIRELKDPRVKDKMLTVVRVEVSQDLSYAKVFVSSLSGIDDAKQAVKGLESATGLIRHEVGKRLRLRKAPELKFAADDSVEHGMEIFKSKDNILILTHRSPDGDTLGCAFALRRVLSGMGKTVMVDCSDDIPNKYSYMWGESEENYNPQKSMDFSPDFVLAVDVADSKLLGARLTEKYPEIPLCIDHHISNTGYADMLCLKDSAAACEIVYDVIKCLGVKPDACTADCLYTGISTDTGCFRYSNVTPETHVKAAELISLGARFDEINRVMFETKTRTYLRLEELVLNSIEMYFGGKCAVITITKDMFKQSGSNETECDGIASLPRKIEGVKVGVTLRERADGTFKVSLRTYAPVDASAICAKMGGGGHARAAGCDFSADYADGKKQLLEIIKTELEKA